MVHDVFVRKTKKIMMIFYGASHTFLQNTMCDYLLHQTPCYRKNMSDNISYPFIFFNRVRLPNMPELAQLHHQDHNNEEKSANRYAYALLLPCRSRIRRIEVAKGFMFRYCFFFRTPTEKHFTNFRIFL